MQLENMQLENMQLENMQLENGIGKKPVQISFNIFSHDVMVIKEFNQLHKKFFYTLASNTNFRITISLQPDVVNLRFFKLRLFELAEFVV